ncbi:MAG: hypothetical protein JOY84_14025 [Curvibacter sp.]|nr:hypothetical protein [Curvibacter sp.]
MSVSQTQLNSALSASTTRINATVEQNAQGNDLTQRDAWLREIEKNQISAWFANFHRAPLDLGALTASPSSTQSLHGSVNSLSDGALSQPTPVVAETQQSASSTSATSTGNWSPSAPMPSAQMASVAPGADLPARVWTGVTQEAQAPYGLQPPGTTSSGSQPIESTAKNGSSIAQREIATQPGLQVARTQGSRMPNALLPSPQGPVLSIARVATGIQTAPQQIRNLPLLSLGKALDFGESMESTSESVEGTALQSGGLKGAGPSIRMHAQWLEDKVNVWLGIDGSAQQVQQQAALLIPELARQLDAQGRKLGKVVCNGHLVYSPDEGTSMAAVGLFDQALAAQPQSSGAEFWTSQISGTSSSRVSASEAQPAPQVGPASFNIVFDRKSS